MTKGEVLAPFAHSIGELIGVVVVDIERGNQ